MLVLLLAFLGAISPPASAATPLQAAVPPRPSRYVTDNAGALDAARAEALNHKLAEFERQTSNQLLVYVDRDLPQGTTLEEFTSEALHQWKVGQQGKDNGAILFVFTDAHKLRIETGYGVEEKLTDAKAKRITSTVMKPLLKANDTTGAVEAGAGAMMDAIRGLDFQGTGKTVHDAQSGTSGPPIAGCIVLVLLVVGFLLAGFLIFRSARRRRTTPGDPTQPATPWWSMPVSGSSSSSDDRWSSSSSSDSYDSSSSSSDDFSSGGGDGGGGGASDSW